MGEYLSRDEKMDVEASRRGVKTWALS